MSHIVLKANLKFCLLNFCPWNLSFQRTLHSGKGFIKKKKKLSKRLVVFWTRWTIKPVFLLSLQDVSNQSAVALCCPQTSIPLLMACTANVKTVVANPIVYLTNLTHDILQTINALDSPPHPDVVNNKVKNKNKQTAATAGICCRWLIWLFFAQSRQKAQWGQWITAKGALEALLYKTFISCTFVSKPFFFFF